MKNGGFMPAVLEKPTVKKEYHEVFLQKANLQVKNSQLAEIKNDYV